MLTIYTYDENKMRIEFTTTLTNCKVSGVFREIIENDANVQEIQIDPDNLYYYLTNTRTRNKYILEYINKYIDICNGEILQDIPAPCIYPNKQQPDLKTATLIDEKTRAVNDIWADFIDNIVINCPKTETQLYNTNDLFCLLHAANYLDLKHLISLCAVKISSYMALCQWPDNILENVPKNFKRALDGLPILPD